MTKVFVASGLSKGDINQQFSFLPAEFEMTTDPNEAEFIIYDLCNIAANWPQFLGMPTYKSTVIFVALSEEDTSNWDIIKSCYKCTPLKFKTDSEVVEFLKWWSQNEYKMLERARDMILAKEKGG